MQSFTQPVLTRLKPDLMLECPNHQNRNLCELCKKRQLDQPCDCEMCLTYSKKKEQTKTAEKTLHLANKMYTKLNKRRLGSKPLEQVLHLLLYPYHKTISHAFGLFIPEICFYKDGEAQVLYCNGETNQKIPGLWPPPIFRIKKQKLNNIQIQKIFNQKRRKYREKVSNTRLIQREQCRVKSAHQKRQKKDNNTDLQLKINKKSDKSFKNKQESQKKKIYLQKKEQQYFRQPKDAVVIRKDKTYEELIQENQFISLMLLRKQDPKFKPIDFIKNFIGIEDQDKHVYFCKHQQGKTKFKQLFERSRIYIRVMATNIIAGEQQYISNEQQALFLQSLAVRSPQSYAYYTLYKIIHYIQSFHDQKVTLISAKFLVNQLNQLYLLHVYSLKKYDLIKYNWNQETYQKKVSQNQNKMLLRTPKVQLDSLSKHRSCMIQKQMRSQYQELKIAMGLGQVQQNDHQQQKNNAFFAILHPELPAPIAQLLKQTTMTVQRFQRKYLGYKDQKKSVASDFNSNLVKTLHKMTPAIKAAKGHELQNRNFPKTFCLHSRSVINKRSFSMGNTISTLNKTRILL